MSEQSTAVAVPAKPKPPVKAGSNGLVLTGIEEMFRFAEMVAQSGLAPKGIDKPASICTAIQMGLEIGLSPMQALQSIAVINGRPGIYGDAAKALVESSGLMSAYDQWFELDGKKIVTADGHNRTPTVAEMKNESLMCCVMSRRGDRPPLVTTFSVGDAKAAGLWGKTGPWAQYPARMLMFRARGFNLRDNFGDVLKGLRTSEELRDMPHGEDEVVPTTGPKTSTLLNRLTSIRNGHVETNGHAEADVVTDQGEVVPATTPVSGDNLFPADDDYEAALRRDEQKRQAAATA
jgi:hypothetical protein